MADERIFLNESNIYVSNTKVILHGTTFATANITSVSKRLTPASTGCAVILIVLGMISILGAISIFGALIFGAFGTFKADQVGCSLVALLSAAVILAAGVFWLRSLKPTYHVFLASASAERSGLSSQDEALVDRVTAAISDAITHRG
jgi:hypothetical protein